RIDRDQADRRVLRPVLRARQIAFTVLDGHLHRDAGAAVQRADHQIRIEDLDIVPGLDRPGPDFAGTRATQADALGAFAVHAQPDALDVEDDIGDVLEHAGKRREFVQHALDLHRGD